MFDKRHKDKENLIILNGQLKYYQFTLPYWKKFSQINNCQFLIISQSVISYKDKKNEMDGGSSLDKTRCDNDVDNTLYV